ncbi:hypothetical protein HJC23_012559, partial [Cyclotella cryptica]
DPHAHGTDQQEHPESIEATTTVHIIQFQHPHCCIHQRLRSPKSASSLCRPSSSIVTKNGKSNSEAMWDPTSQTYKDGIVPSHHAAMEIDDLLQVNQRKLRRFGCGWLSLSPCTEGSLSLADIEPDELDHYVTTTERTEKGNHDAGTCYWPSKILVSWQCQSSRNTAVHWDSLYVA